jgi:hypothetical protein
MKFHVEQPVRATVVRAGIPAGTTGTVIGYDPAYDDYHVLMDTPEGAKGTYGGDELAPIGEPAPDDSR